jgi:hypothetical protein
MKYDPADNILSSRAKRLKKNADEKPYFENTNDVLGLYKNPTLKSSEGSEEDEDEDKKASKPKGFALLKRIYGGGEPVATVANNLLQANRVAKTDPLYRVSNPKEVQRKAFEIYGKDAVVYKSDKPNKKYQMMDTLTGKTVYFGDAKMEDFTKHQDAERRRSYLARALNIKGQWRQNPYSPNILSLVLLWNAE